MNRPDSRTYRISPLRFSLIGLPAVFVVGLLGVLGIATSDAALLIAALLVAMIFAPLIFIVWRTRLILSSEGVDLRQLGYRLTTSWSNVAAVDGTPGRQGFVLRYPLESRGAYRLAGMVDVQVVSGGVAMATYQGGRPDLVVQRRFIPFEAFGYWLSRGDLESTIRGFAPDVEMEAHEITIPRLPLKTRILVIAIIAVSASLGLLLGLGVLPPSVNAFFARIFNSVGAIYCLAIGLVGLSSSVHLARTRRPALAVLGLVAALVSLAAAVYLAK